MGGNLKHDEGMYIWKKRSPAGSMSRDDRRFEAEHLEERFCWSNIQRCL